jgi:hypothetical protein
MEDTSNFSGVAADWPKAAQTVAMAMPTATVARIILFFLLTFFSQLPCTPLPTIVTMVRRKRVDRFRLDRFLTPQNSLKRHPDGDSATSSQILPDAEGFTNPPERIVAVSDDAVGNSYRRSIR